MMIQWDRWMMLRYYLGVTIQEVKMLLDDSRVMILPLNRMMLCYYNDPNALYCLNCL